MSTRKNPQQSAAKEFWQNMPGMSVVVLLAVMVAVGWPWMVWHNSPAGWIVGVLWNLCVSLPVCGAKIADWLGREAEAAHARRVKELEKLKAARIAYEQLAAQLKAQGSSLTPGQFRAAEKEHQKQEQMQQARQEKSRLQAERRRVQDELAKERAAAYSRGTNVF